MSNEKDYDYKFKILSIGNSGVGKSCLLLRYSEDKFQQTFINTIGVDFVRSTNTQFPKYIDYQGKKIKLMLWDTAGQERFKTITRSFYNGAHGIIIVYDITDRDSFNNVCAWYDEMSKNVNQNFACMFVANKIDMSSRRVVSYEEGLALANKYELPFEETSAKTAKNVSNIFSKLVGQILKINQSNKDPKFGRHKPPVAFNRKHQTEEEYCKCCMN